MRIQGDDVGYMCKRWSNSSMTLAQRLTTYQARHRRQINLRVTVLSSRRIKGHVHPELDQEESFPWAMPILIQQVGELEETGEGSAHG
jgi:hypothetical protein